jgi:hypothetical protein
LLFVCHPETPAPAIRSIDANAALRPDGTLALSFRLDGDAGRLTIPPTLCGERADGLWRHTCFEAFVAFADQTNYLEFNFSPSGQWAAYAFSAYRQRDPQADPQGAPEIKVQRDENGLMLATQIPAGVLPPNIRASNLGLSAVVESMDGQLSYWALRHPTGQPTPKPDFHRRDTFALALLPLLPSR